MAKEAEKEKKTQNGQISTKRIALYFLLTLVLYFIFFAFFIFEALNWPKEGKVFCGPPGSGLNCSIELCPPNLPGFFLIAILLVLFLSVVSYILSMFYTEKKIVLIEFSAGMLLSGIFGLFIGGIFSRTLGSFVLGLLGFSSC